MFRKLLSTAIFGSPLYNVRITELVVKRSSFKLYSANDGVDVAAIERYGLAIHGARDFKDNQWHYTDKGNLVCGNAEGISTIIAKIVIDDNLNFLAKRYHFAHRDMSKWPAVKVRIIGLHPEEGEQIVPGPFSLVFLGNAKE